MQVCHIEKDLPGYINKINTFGKSIWSCVGLINTVHSIIYFSNYIGLLKSIMSVFALCWSTLLGVGGCTAYKACEQVYNKGSGGIQIPYLLCIF